MLWLRYNEMNFNYALLSGGQLLDMFSGKIISRRYRLILTGSETAILSLWVQKVTSLQGI